VQDLELRGRAIRYRRERWLTPDEHTVIAALKASVSGHFGVELRRFALMQYHQGQVTAPQLTAQLEATGVRISKRPVMRLLITVQDDVIAEANDVLQAGLQTARWITVEDTGPVTRTRMGSARLSVTTASPGSRRRAVRRR